MKTPRKWNEERERLYVQHIRDMSDRALSDMLKVSVKYIRFRRKQDNIPKWSKSKYKRIHLEWLRQNYKNMWFEEFFKAFNEKFPEVKAAPGGLEHFMRQERLVKTRDEINALMKRDMENGICKKRTQEYYATANTRKPGVPYFSKWYKRWMVMLENGNSITHESYLWQQVHGPVPANKFVKVIDSTKAITIDNIMLESRGLETFKKHSHALSDAWILGTLVSGIKDKEDKEFARTVYSHPIFIKEQRNKIIAIREIKAKLHGTNRDQESSKQNEA